MPENGVISQSFAGINRAVSPVLLPESESPLATNCAASGGKHKLLGARKGRKAVYLDSNRILGVIPFNLPTQRYRVIGTTDGSWTATTVTWPSAPNPLDDWHTDLWSHPMHFIISGLFNAYTANSPTFIEIENGFSNTENRQWDVVAYSGYLSGYVAPAMTSGIYLTVTGATSVRISNPNDVNLLIQYGFPYDTFYLAPGQSHTVSVTADSWVYWYWV